MSLEIGHDLETNKAFCLKTKDVVASRTYIASETRFGKSHTCRKIVEECFGHVGIIIIDPEGEYASLREKYGFIIIGRDIPIEVETETLKATTAEFMAQQILSAGASAIIDLSVIEDFEAGKEYVDSFLRRFFHLQTTAKKPYLVIWEEAEDFAPESGAPGTRTCLETAITYARRGGKRGIGVIYVGHRPAWISKGILSQCPNKAIGRIESTDMKALEDYARIPGSIVERLVPKTNETGETIYPGPSRGEFYFVGDWVEKPTFVKVGPVKTTHLGASPDIIPPSPKEIEDVIASSLKGLPQFVKELQPAIASTKEIEAKVRTELDGKYRARIEAIQRTANDKAERKFKVEIDHLRELNDKLSRSQALQPTSPVTDVLEHPIVKTRMSELSDKGHDLLVKVEREQGLTRQQLAAFLTTSTDSVATLIATINRVFRADVIVGEGKPIKYRSMLKRLFITDIGKREIEELARLQGELGQKKLVIETLQVQNERLKKENGDSNQKLREVVPALEKLQKTSQQQVVEIERLKREYQELALMSKAGMALSAGIKEIVDNRLKEIHPASVAANPVDEKRIVEIVKQQAEPFLLNMQKTLEERLSGVTPQPSEGTAISLEQKVTHFDLQKDEVHLKTDTTNLQGRILKIITEGFFDTRHTKKEVFTELSHHGWSHDESEVETELVNLCQLGVFYRKISTGKAWWYTLQPEAKNLIHA
jgi:hypothetical protein